MRLDLPSFNTAGRLLFIIGGAAGTAFLIRGFLVKNPSPAAVAALDGVSAIVVVGLMSAVGPAIRERPADLVLALGPPSRAISASSMLRRRSSGGRRRSGWSPRSAS